MILYRYRPLKITEKIDVADEISRLEIFMATLDENNDPMDGTLEIEWNGDEILWDNFLKHYCYCLMDSYYFFAIAGNSHALSESIIPVLKTHQDSPTKEHAELIKKFYKKAKNIGEFKALNKLLISRGKVSSSELNFLLRFIHHYLLNEAVRLVKDSTGYDPSIPNNPGIDKNISKAFYESISNINEKELNAISQISEQAYDEISMITKLNTGNISIIQDNYKKIWFDFPKMYINESRKNIFYENYISCFSERNDIEPMWSHYSQGHRGICLVYEFADKHIELENGKKLPILKVKYDEAPPKVNYFECLGHLPMPKLASGWMSKNGRTSKMYDIYKNDYPNIYWSKFNEKSSHKFMSWSYEKEHRVVDSSWFHGKKEKPDRLVKYHEKHLIGAVFGIRTPLDEQIKIANAIDKKLSQGEKEKFKFYKAYFCPINNEIKIKEMSLVKFSKS